ERPERERERVLHDDVDRLRGDPAVGRDRPEVERVRAVRLARRVPVELVRRALLGVAQPAVDDELDVGERRARGLRRPRDLPRDRLPLLEGRGDGGRGGLGVRGRRDQRERRDDGYEESHRPWTVTVTCASAKVPWGPIART